MSVHIDIADHKDIPAICRLNLDVQTLHARLAPAVFKLPASADIFQPFWAEKLRTPDNWVAVARVEDVVAGYSWFELQTRPETPFTLARRRLYVHHIAVDPALRHQRVGSALMAFAETTAATHALETVVLDAWAANTTAHSFFHTLGYTVLTSVLTRTLP